MCGYEQIRGLQIFHFSWIKCSLFFFIITEETGGPGSEQDQAATALWGNLAGRNQVYKETICIIEEVLRKAAHIWGAQWKKSVGWAIWENYSSLCLMFYHNTEKYYYIISQRMCCLSHPFHNSPLSLPVTALCFVTIWASSTCMVGCQICPVQPRPNMSGVTILVISCQKKNSGSNSPLLPLSNLCMHTQTHTDADTHTLSSVPLPPLPLSLFHVRTQAHTQLASLYTCPHSIACRKQTQ